MTDHLKLRLTPLRSLASIGQMFALGMSAMWLRPGLKAALASAVVVGGFTPAASALGPPQCWNVFDPEISLQKTRDEFADERLRQMQSRVIELAPNRKLYAQLVEPESLDEPFYLLLPGANRALASELGAFRFLARQGAGMMSLNFSTQPQSIATLPSGVRPYFKDHTMTLEDLADEVEQVAAGLRAQGYRNVVAVSLSYSGSVSPYLKSFPLIVESSPMTSNEAVSPKLARYMQLLRAGQLWNPWFGASITRAHLDQFYEKNWTEQVEKMIEQFQLSSERRSDMIEGYASMSRAAEDFDWQNLPELPSRTRRVFMIAGGEEPGLLRHQLETVKDFARTHRDVSLFIVNGADHLIATSQPELYAKALQYARLRLFAGTGVSVHILNPGESEMKSAHGEQALKWIDIFLTQASAELTKRDQ